MSKSNARLVGILLLVALICVGVLWLMWPTPDRWDQEAQQQTMAAAEPMIQALWQHIDDVGEPPDSLQDLVPGYIDQIPVPVVGSQAWSYRKTQHGFTLSVMASDADPPSAVLMMIIGPYGIDDRIFRYNTRTKTWAVEEDW